MNRLIYLTAADILSVIYCRNERKNLIDQYQHGYVSVYIQLGLKHSVWAQKELLYRLGILDTYYKSGPVVESALMV